MIWEKLVKGNSYLVFKKIIGFQKKKKPKRNWWCKCTGGTRVTLKGNVSKT